LFAPDGHVLEKWHLNFSWICPSPHPPQPATWN
jgi:hypothetical protein